MSPTAFSELRKAALLPAELAPEVDQLTQEKRLAREADRTRLSVELVQWIEAMMSQLETRATTAPTGEPIDWRPLNQLFRATIG